MTTLAPLPKPTRPVPMRHRPRRRSALPVRWTLGALELTTLPRVRRIVAGRVSVAGLVASGAAWIGLDRHFDGIAVLLLLWSAAMLLCSHEPTRPAERPRAHLALTARERDAA